MLDRKLEFATKRTCRPTDYGSVKGLAADLRLWMFGLVRSHFRVPVSCRRFDALADGMWPNCGLPLRGRQRFLASVGAAAGKRRRVALRVTRWPLRTSGITRRSPEESLSI